MFLGRGNSPPRSASTFSSIIGMFETTAGYYLAPGLIPYWDTPLYFLSPITYVLQVREPRQGEG